MPRFAWLLFAVLTNSFTCMAAESSQLYMLIRPVDLANPRIRVFLMDLPESKPVVGVRSYKKIVSVFVNEKFFLEQPVETLLAQIQAATKMGVSRITTEKFEGLKKDLRSKQGMLNAIPLSFLKHSHNGHKTIAALYSEQTPMIVTTGDIYDPQMPRLILIPLEKKSSTQTTSKSIEQLYP